MSKTRARSLVLFSLLSLAFPAAAAEKAVLSGVVVDEGGKPLEGVSLKIADQELLTDAEGRYSCEAPPGPTMVAFNRFTPDAKESWKTLRPQGSPELVITKPGEKVDLKKETYYRYGAILEGVCVMDHSNPATDARVYCATDGGLFIGRAEIDKKGAFRMKLPLANGLEEGYSLRLAFHGPSSLRDDLEIGKLETWAVNRIVFTVTSSFQNLYGRLVVKGGSAEGVKISLMKAGQRSSLSFFPVVKTDGDGHFVFRDVPFGNYVIFGYSARTGLFRQDHAHPSKPAWIEVAPPALGSVEGTFTLLVDGKPSAHADPDAERLGCFDGVFLADERGKLLLPALPVALARIESGSFVFRVEGLAPGKSFFHLRRCQKCEDFSQVESAQEMVLSASGIRFTHEGFVLIHQDPPPEQVFRDFCTEVKPGETVKVEKKLEYTLEELLKLLGGR